MEINRNKNDYKYFYYYRCWLSTEHDSAAQFALFYGPLGLAMLLSIPMMAHAIYIINKV